jgi:hypothetical protein
MPWNERKEVMSSTNNLNTKDGLEQRIRGLIAGTQKHPPSAPVALGGSTYTAQALEQVFQGLLDALTASDTARAAWEDTVTKVRARKATVLPLARAYANTLLAANGNTSSVLADYGLTPRKARAPMTTDQQAAAVAKRKATRAARHTMGSVQKKAVKGDVTGVNVTPVTSPAPTPATPPPTPATPASSGGGEGATPAAPAAPVAVAPSRA